MLNTRSEKAIASFVNLLDDLRGRLDDELGDLVEAVLDRTGYRTELESSSDPQDLARLDNLNELVSVAHEFSTDRANAAALESDADTEDDDEDVPPTGILAEFLERVSLVADSDELPEHGSGVVTLMTLHTAKGLEFPVVFVTGWEDGCSRTCGRWATPPSCPRSAGWPTSASPAPGSGCTSAAPRSGHRGSAHAEPGIAVPARDPRRADRLAAYRSHAVVQRSRPVLDRWWWHVRYAAPVADPQRRAGKRPLLVLEAGDRVTHDKYGLGRVEEVSGMGSRRCR